MDILETLSKFNWQTIISMFIIGWYFTREIRSTLQTLEMDVKEQGKRTDKLYEMFCEVQKEIKQIYIDKKG